MYRSRHFCSLDPASQMLGSSAAASSFSTNYAPRARDRQQLLQQQQQSECELGREIKKKHSERRPVAILDRSWLGAQPHWPLTDCYGRRAASAARIDILRSRCHVPVCKQPSSLNQPLLLLLLPAHHATHPGNHHNYWHATPARCHDAFSSCLVARLLFNQSVPLT